MVIYKYELPMPDKDGFSRVMMSANARPLSVGIQGRWVADGVLKEVIVVWALVSGLIRETEILRPFVVANTGQAFPAGHFDGKFLGTVTTSNAIVWHIFDYWSQQ